MVRKRTIIMTLIILLLVSFVGCGDSIEKVDEIDGFSLKTEDAYMLFHFRDPYDKKGYILQYNLDNSKSKKYIITDSQFAPSDIFFFDDKYYFASGGYSGTSDILSYDPSNKEFEVIESNQERYIEKFYKDDKGMYITTVIDKNGGNILYDINNKKSISSLENEFILEVASLDDEIISIAINYNNDRCRISKYDRSLNFIAETIIDASVSTYPHLLDDNYLYLFSNYSNGEVYRIDSKLNVTVLDTNLNKLVNSDSIEYGKVIYVGDNKALCQYFYYENETSKTGLVEYEFKDNTVNVKALESNPGEKILNANYKSNEFYTREYKNSKAIIRVRDLDSNDIIKTFNLNNDDVIYFVDKNIK